MTQDKTDAPKTIWLQVGDEPCSYSEAMICGDVSWCANKVFEYDIEYKLVEPIKSQTIPSQDEPVACMYVNDDGGCDEIGHLDNYNGIIPDEFTPLYTKPQPTSQDAIDKPCICEGGRFIVTGVSINSNADEIANITVFDKEKDNLNYLRKPQTTSQDLLKNGGLYCYVGSPLYGIYDEWFESIMKIKKVMKESK